MLSRMEHDSIGALNVPAEAYYGVQSMRAATNFQITHRPLHPVLIDSIVMVKKAAAITNKKSGKLDQQIAQAIIKACDCQSCDRNLWWNQGRLQHCTSKRSCQYVTVYERCNPNGRKDHRLKITSTDDQRT